MRKSINLDEKQILKITNDIKGLYNYFTAPNIRHKNFHPLFILFKFSECINIYYRKELFSENLR